MKATLTTGQFYDSACKQKGAYEMAFYKENRYSVFNEKLSLVYEQLLSGIPKQDIVSSFRDAITRSYKDEWFPFYWEKGAAIEDDVFCVERLLEWIGCHAYQVLRAHVPVQAILCDTLVKSEVSLLLQDDTGGYVALVVSNKKTDRSIMGKSVHTAILSDLDCMIAKHFLESQYADIQIVKVYLRCADETQGNLLPSLIRGTTKKHHVFFADYASYYADGAFDKERFLAMMETVFETPLPMPCFECKYGALCHVTQDEEEVVSQEKEVPYVLPQYTQEQLQVVNHLKGAMRVCAGPGSGKTATLVGRIKHLIDSGVEPEFILCITFAKEAANELAHRVSSFCSEDSMPYIATLNALGYDIIRQNADVLGKRPMLTEAMKMELIENLHTVYDQLSGFNYAMKDGKHGLYRMISTRLDAYFADEEHFFEKYPQHSYDFVEFAKEYAEIVRARGLITFDEQISLCNQLFAEYPEIAEVYSRRFQYVMVDEYQDVNEQQALLCDTIASHGNLVVVGDDDQSIYRFRGGSNRFLLDFGKRFPDAKSVILSKNFRSSSGIVKEAEKVIAQNEQRIFKDITCDNVGNEPIYVQGTSAHVIDGIISQCIGNGCRFGDIAILTRKNSTLEELHKNLTHPTVLAKRYLRSEPLFLLLKCILDLFFSQCRDDAGWYVLGQLFNLPIPTTNVYENLLRQGYADLLDYDYYQNVSTDEPLVVLLSKLSNIYEHIENLDCVTFNNMAACMFGYEESKTLEVLNELVLKQQLRGLSAYRDYLDYSYEYDDQTKVPVVQGNRVLLITSHESKGKEYPVVILVEPDKNNNKDDEDRRVLYVSMTRAKQVLYICSD